VSILSFFRRQLHKLPSGDGVNLVTQQAYGHWYVVYDDGKQKSQRFYYKSAKRYAKIRGGKVKYSETRSIDEKDRYAPIRLDPKATP
jgi:hypothetical protein